MKLSRKAFDFNKEILMGEVGAIIGAPLFGILGAIIYHSPNIISTFTIIGSIVGCSSMWFVTKIHDEKKEGDVSVKKLAKKISLLTPVAILISILIGYPLVFIVTHALSAGDHITFFSSLMGEMAGFTVFLFSINTYRYVLVKKFGKEL